MEFYRTNTGSIIKHFAGHCLYVSEHGEIDNTGNLDIEAYGALWNLTPISRKEFNDIFNKVMRDVNQFYQL